MSLTDFSLAIDKFIDEDVPGAVKDLTDTIALQALSGVVFKSPVDTGRFRGNWQVSIGEAVDTALDVTDKQGASTVNKGLTAIAGAAPFSLIILTNNVPYAVPIEQGSSKQAPAGVVAVTMAEIESQFVE